LGGVRVMRSLLDSGSAEREIATKGSVGSTEVDMDEIEVFDVVICMVVGEKDGCKAQPSHIKRRLISCRLLCTSLQLHCR
jgi:hypothetical protein